MTLSATERFSGLRLEHRLPKARTDDMDVLEGCLFLLVPQNLLQVSYGHAVVDVMRAEGVTQGMHSGFSHPCFCIVFFDQFTDTAGI